MRELKIIWVVMSPDPLGDWDIVCLAINGQQLPLVSSTKVNVEAGFVMMDAETQMRAKIVKFVEVEE